MQESSWICFTQIWGRGGARRHPGAPGRQLRHGTRTVVGLRDPLSTLKGVGPKVAEAFARLGLSTLEDALFHLPLRYEDRTRITPLAAVRQGQAVVFEVTIRAAQVAFGRRRSLVLKVEDASGLATLRLFHFSKAQQQQLKPGRPLRGFGEGRGGSGGIEFVHPELTFLDGGAAPALDDRLTPIYPTTEGLGQARLRSLLHRALALLEGAGAEALGLTETLLADLRHLHTPPVGTDLATLEAGLDPAQQRLAFDELLAHQLAKNNFRNLLEFNERSDNIKGFIHFHSNHSGQNFSQRSAN